MRDDLVALNPAALSSLSSVGLLKRAQRMVATGLGPAEIEESDDGIVTATFADGTVTSLPPKATLAQARCSCGAVFACRHGLALVLAYQAREGGEESVQEDWNPGEIADKDVIKLIGSLGRGRANRLMRGGIVVRVDRSPHPTARLPTCTLQFLVPHDLTHARCDCELVTACEHLLIAVRAFRQAGDAGEATVEIAATGEVDLEATRDATELAREVLWHGMANAPEALDARFERVRQRLDADGQVWPVSVLDELQSALKWYRARSARYRPALAEAAAELDARLRAVDCKTPRLPVGMVLGTAIAAETRLAELRLTSLGARVRAEGSTSITDVFLVDADTNNVLVLRFPVTAPRKRNQQTEPSAPTGPEVAQREIVKGVRLGDLATGQLLTQTARRRANRELVLSLRSGTQVVREPGDWSALDAPVRLNSLADLVAQSASRAPAILRPRVLAENLHVFEIKEVGNLVWSPGEQALVGEVVIASGETVRIMRRHRGAAPHAISALAAALASKPRWMSGEVRFTEAGIVVSPAALQTGDGLVVPDLATETSSEVPLGKVGAPSSALGAALDQATSLMDESAHAGLLALSNAWVERTLETASHLEGVGLARLAESLRAVVASAKSARVGGRKAAPEAPHRWMDTRIALSLARESLHAPEGSP
ncbi:MAG: hypothetical protein AAGE52_12040 [Myxococcota bacterium]